MSRHTILRDDSGEAGFYYNFGQGLASSVANGDTYASLMAPIGLASFVAIDDDSDVRGVMIREPDREWRQLRESEVLCLSQDVERLELSRLDRTSGTLRLATSLDEADVDAMRSTVRNWARIEFDTDDNTDLRDLYLHMPRYRNGLMRWVMRSNNDGTAVYTIKGHCLAYSRADANQSEFEPSRERGNNISTLEATSLATGSTTASTAETISGIIDGVFDVLELSLSGSNRHQGTFFVGPA